MPHGTRRAAQTKGVMPGPGRGGTVWSVGSEPATGRVHCGEHADQLLNQVVPLAPLVATQAPRLGALARALAALVRVQAAGEALYALPQAPR